MKKKKTKKPLSIKEENATGKLGNQLSKIITDVKKHKTINQHKSHKLLESENDIVKCVDCFFKTELLDGCDWFRENKCTFKCKRYKKSIEQFGFVDINKVKHHNISPEEDRFRKNLKKYMHIAEHINEIYEEEQEKIRQKKRKEMIAQKIKEMKEMDKVEQEPDIKEKRRKLKSLI